jgi:DNA polymerase
MSEKINLQNLGARGHELIVRIRELLRAPKNHKFVIVDSSQIEARVLAWWAGQTDLLQRFANGEDVYKSFAAESVLKKPVEEITKKERQGVGKVGVLGGGYGMGWKKAQIYSLSYVEEMISDELATAVISGYREANPRIVNSWYASESAFRNVIRRQPPKTVNGVLFKRGIADCDVALRLPSRRELKYHEVRLKDNPNYKNPTLQVYNKIERKWGHIWGGHLVENIIQAISRDLLCYFMLEIERITGYRVVLTVHDELILVCPTEVAPEVLAIAIDVMRTPPAWAVGCPLDAEGFVSDRYGGH